jgi:GMP synthase-like glutamine amidotransferase
MASRIKGASNARKETCITSRTHPGKSGWSRRLHPFTEEGNKNPLYEGFAGHQQAFQWHEDCFQLPEGAVALAHHIQGFNQAFRYGQHAYGLQYHIELTENMLDVWLHDPPMKNDKLSSIQLPR